MNKRMGILILILLMVFSGLAMAEITRSCTAQISVGVRSIEGGEGVTYPPFTGQGTNPISPTYARKEARMNIMECIGSTTNREREIAYCSEVNLIYNYPFPEGFMEQVTNDICSLNPGHDTIDIVTYLTLQGDRGCTLYPNQWLEGPYESQITCPSTKSARITRPSDTSISKKSIPSMHTLCIAQDKPLQGDEGH